MFCFPPKEAYELSDFSSSKINKAKLDCIIISAGYDVFPSRESAIEEAVWGAAWYAAKGKECISANIYRFEPEENGFGCNKFTDCLLHSIPLIVYVLCNFADLNKEGIECRVVGNKYVKDIVGIFNRLFGTNYKHVQEGKSIGENIHLASKDFPKDTLFAFIPADLPFFYDLYSAIIDEDIKKAYAVMDFNAKENFEPENNFWPRNYYFPFRDKRAYKTKEPNLIIGKLKEIDLNAFDLMYSNRKHGKYILATAKAMLKSPLNLIEVLPTLTGILFSYLGVAKVPISRTPLQIAGKVLTKKPIIVKARHNDVTRLMDIDSWYDLALAEALLSPETYPYWKMAERFKQEGMPELRKAIPYYRSLQSCIEELHKDLQQRAEEVIDEIGKSSTERAKAITKTFRKHGLSFDAFCSLFMQAIPPIDKKAIKENAEHGKKVLSKRLKEFIS